MKRGRFAPSPTGPLHFGSLVTALASYCDARSRDAQWLVRMDDVDAARTRPGAADAILATLDRYGFRWDGPVVTQGSQTACYAGAIDALHAAGLVYRCDCSRQHLAQAPVAASGEHVYPGTCRGRRDVGGRAWRVRVPDETIGFEDRLQGWQAQQLARDVGDFIVQRADGLHAYQLAVVVDDAWQAVTSVVRGADLLSSTPRQVWLQRVLGFPTPAYLHVPVAVDEGGRKLSKETAAAALPVAPLPALRAAWRFLRQPEPVSARSTVGEFWAYAIGAWDPACLPRSTSLHATTFGASAGEKV